MGKFLQGHNYVTGFGKTRHLHTKFLTVIPCTGNIWRGKILADDTSKSIDGIV